MCDVLSDAQKGAARAEGALLDFFDRMSETMINQGRSAEYKVAFWMALGQLMQTKGEAISFLAH